MDPNCIAKQVQLDASRDRVWQAISDARQFGSWFGVDFDGPFVAGKSMIGRIVPTTVDAEVAKMQKPYEGMKFECVVKNIEPQQKFSFGWHPFAVDTGKDYSNEPMTEVQFELKDVQDGTLLTITESGFEKIPEERRAKAYAANEGGWSKQTELIQKYLEKNKR